MSPGVEVCVQNCRDRAWEPHKYSSKEAQDEGLDFLIEWVKEYYEWDDDFSAVGHRRVF